MSITFYHDDDALSTIDKINEELEAYGLFIEDDGLEHDGFMVCEIKEVEEE